MKHRRCAVTNDEQKIIDNAIARAFEMLSKELGDAFKQFAHLSGRAQEQQDKILAFIASQAEALKMLADLVVKSRHDDAEGHNEHTDAIEQLLQGQKKIAQFSCGLATQYGQLFKALSNRLDAVEKEAFGASYDSPPSTPPLN
jgi:hypothetical protein